MIVIPAVDIKGGKCVRLFQGEMDKETVFSDSPAEMARRWEEEGAALIHLVDLDGAIEKNPVNMASIKEIVDTVKTPLQLGGGIRDMKTIHALVDLGIEKIIIGTEAVKNPGLIKDACREFPGKIVVGIDARGGRVAIEGWTETTETLAVDLAKKFEDCGVAAINFTDIHRDGMHSGPNLEETVRLAEAVSIPVIASGGVSTIDDIKNLKALESRGIAGVITGRALYDGSLDLREAISVATGA